MTGVFHLEAVLPAPSGDETTIITPDGAALRVLTDGDGPCVLLVNGFGVGIEEWSLVWPELVTQGYHVVGYDARGTGRSTIGSLGVTAASMRADFTAVLAELGIGPVTVVSHSMGNFVALAALATDPEGRARIGHYIAVAPMTGAAHQDAMTRVQVPMLKLGVLQAISRNKRVGRMLARASLGSRPSAAVVEAWRQGLTAVPKAVMPMLDAMRDESLSDHLGGYDLPTTVLTGSADVQTPYRHVRAILNGIPSAAVRFVPEGGHMLNYEGAADIVALVNEVSAGPRADVTATPGGAVTPRPGPRSASRATTR